ncbi:3935_t:CDS:2 [Funneliformis mosseae]|uniref:3935_t:CDS:1 n=1 Tax=Funneliformis mosseae TaxID=27381 RepID=A0A9N9AWZ7_FUNMO|nr:3935_t:CDS:2 [Funneliformis mosseae]
MYSVFLAGYDLKTPDNPDSEDPKKKYGIQKNIELVQVKVIKIALRKGSKYDNLAKNYGDYLKKLQAEKNLNNYIKILTVKMFFKKKAYTERLENYHKRYKDNDLYSNLKKLYKLYYQIARKENRKRSDEEIE